MKKLILTFIVALLLSACTTSDKNYKFNNDLENIDGWFDQKQIVKGDAHSGDYCSIITPEAHYGITFRKKLADFNNGKKMQTIYTCVWIKLSGLDSKGSFVISIDEPSDFSPIVYNAVKLQDQITEPGKWECVKNKIDVPPGMDLNKVVSIYAGNDGKNNIYVDDISYYFE